MQERGEAKRNTGLFMDDALRLTAIDGSCAKLLDGEILGVVGEKVERDVGEKN